MNTAAPQQLADRLETVEGDAPRPCSAEEGLGRSVDEVFDDFEQQAC